MTKKAPAASLLVTHSPISTNEFAAYSAQDSMSMVATAMYNPLIPDGEPVAARTFLLPRKSRRTIMRVRRTLSETATEIHGILYLRRRMAQVLLTGCDIWKMTKIPIPILMSLAQSVTARLWRTQIRTNGCKVHEEGEGDDPKVRGVDHVTTMELGELVLDAWQR